MQKEETLKIKSEIGKLIDNEEYTLDQLDDIYAKILETHKDLDDTDFYDIMDEFIRSLEENKLVENPPEVKEIKTVKRQLSKSPKGTPQGKKSTTEKDGEKSAITPQIVSSTTTSIVEKKEDEMMDDFSNAIDTLEYADDEFNIIEYTQKRMAEMTKVLVSLATPEHYADFPTSEGQKTTATALIATDIFAMSKNIDISYSKPEEVTLPNGDILVRMCCTIIDHNRNIKIENYPAEEYRYRKFTDKVTKKEKIEVGDKYDISKCATRAFRNAYFKMIPKKIINMVIAESKRQLKALGKEKVIKNKQKNK